MLLKIKDFDILEKSKYFNGIIIEHWSDYSAEYVLKFSYFKNENGKLVPVEKSDDMVYCYGRDYKRNTGNISIIKEITNNNVTIKLKLGDNNSPIIINTIITETNQMRLRDIISEIITKLF